MNQSITLVDIVRELWTSEDANNSEFESHSRFRRDPLTQLLLSFAIFVCRGDSRQSPVVDWEPAGSSSIGQTRRKTSASHSPELEPITPDRAVDWYLDHKAQEITEGSIDSYRTSLSYLKDYCEARNISNLNGLKGRDIEEYRRWRRDESTDKSLEPKTMRDEMYLLQDFLRYLVSIDAVQSDIPEKVVIPQLGPSDGVRDEQLESERARQILRHLRKFEYASIDHIFWRILTETGRRIGGLHSLDLKDFYPNADNPYLAFRHRPEKGTRLKNGKASETNVNISEDLCQIIDDYCQSKRPSVEDEYGRQPLLASDEGRLQTSTMRKYVYKWSRPCEVTGECPHDREILECEAAAKANQASKCPSSVSPHPVRHGYITSMLDSEIPKPVLSDRCDVSEAVIDEHYDERSESEKQDLRRRVLDRILDEEKSGFID